MCPTLKELALGEVAFTPKVRKAISASLKSRRKMGLTLERLRLQSLDDAEGKWVQSLQALGIKVIVGMA